MRVLLLEDDNLLSDLLQDHLEDKGYDVTLCLDGQDALEYLIDEKYDLADEMADVMWVLVCLANQTGVDLTDALKRNFEKKSIRDKDRHVNNEKLK